MKKEKWTYNTTAKRPGRPKKGKVTEELIIKLALENSWGYGKIQGEMKKLGYHVSISYMRDVLKKNGIPPSDNRKSISWKQFIVSHMDVIWAIDFFTEEIWTRVGLTTYYVLFFIHLGSRRVHFAGCTPNPNYAWVSQQSRNFSKCNAYSERFVLEARGTLDNLILFGSKHIHQVLKKIEKYHNNYRPHQGIDNIIPLKYNYLNEPGSIEEVSCEEILGGLLNHYYIDKKAA